MSTELNLTTVGRAQGRNGTIAVAGLLVMPVGGTTRISPVTTRGNVGNCFIEVAAAEDAQALGYALVDAARTQAGTAVNRGHIGKHDWCVDNPCSDGYAVFVDDRQLGYQRSLCEAEAYAREVILRLYADGDYRLNDKPAGHLPPPL